MNDYDYRQNNVSRQEKTKNKTAIYLALTALGISVIMLFVSVFFFTSAIFRQKNTEKLISAMDERLGLQEQNDEEANQAISEINEYLSDGTAITLLDVSNVVEGAMPSVVSITSRALVNNGGYIGIWNYYYYSGGDGQNSKEVDSGIGSGTIVGMNDTELLILTSYHVVEGCSSLYVTFYDDTSVDGNIKAAEESKDIAVISVPLEDIPEETKGIIKIAKLSRDGVETGDGIIVIGNALGYGQSVVTGIVSATNRTLDIDGTEMTLIQTDAAINSGNSGGCVLNSKGEIIGISEAKITMPSVEGMCYAIPIKENYKLIEQLMNTETK